MDSYQPLVEHDEVKYVHSTHGSAQVIVLTIAAPVVRDEWRQNIMHNMKKFMKWVKRNNLTYHCVFNLHAVTHLPVDILLDMYQYIKRKTAIITNHLVSTHLIIHSAMVKAVVDHCTALFPPTKPFAIIQRPLEGGCSDNGVPAHLWKDVAASLSAHSP